MKLWEVIKALTEDPTKKFEAKLKSKDWTACMRVDDVFQRYFKFEVLDGERRVVLSGGGAFNNNVTLDLDWQPVRQPVTWQEANQAWAAGRIVSVVVGDCKYLLADAPNPELTRRLIQFGSWFVED